MRQDAARWSVPGRVNLIGEHLDYNGGPVLPFAIDRRVEVRVGRRHDRRLIVGSAGLGTVELDRPLRADVATGWERYVAGALWGFADEMGIDLPGVDVAIDGNLPSGAGLSSSAAVICGVLCALNDIVSAGLEPVRIAALAVRAEGEFVGAPCGPMDPLAVMLAQPGHALLIDTRTLQTEAIPFSPRDAGLTLLVIDTNVRHAVAEGAYGRRRSECEAAAAALGVAHLASATARDASSLTDAVLCPRARHVTSEVERVRGVVASLRSGHLAAAGPLLTASHRSLAEDFEVSCPELDAAVDAALGAGALGARMTGAGFGGSAIALCRIDDIEPIAAAVRDSFACHCYPAPDIFEATPAAGATRLD